MGERPADDAGRGDQDLLGPAGEQARGRRGDGAGAPLSFAAGGGVGATGVDHDAAAETDRARQVIATHGDRGGGEPVGREDAGGRRAAVADDERQVERLPMRAAGCLESAGDAGHAEAAGQPRPAQQQGGVVPREAVRVTVVLREASHGRSLTSASSSQRSNTAGARVRTNTRRKPSRRASSSSPPTRKWPRPRRCRPSATTRERISASRGE